MNEDYTIPFDGNRYCGPAALAYVMRGTPDEAARLIRQVSGKKKVLGTSNRHMLDAIGYLGYAANPSMPMHGAAVPLSTSWPTLAKWLEMYSPEPWQEFIITVTGHYIVVHGERYFDSRCHLGKPISRCPYLRKRVKAAWQIERQA